MPEPLLAPQTPHIALPAAVALSALLGAAAMNLLDPASPCWMCGLQWAVVLTFAGLVAAVSWQEALWFGPGPGFAFGCLLRRTPLRVVIDVFTLRKYQMWRHPDQ